MRIKGILLFVAIVSMLAGSGAYVYDTFHKQPGLYLESESGAVILEAAPLDDNERMERLEAFVGRKYGGDKVEYVRYNFDQECYYFPLDNGEKITTGCK